MQPRVKICSVHRLWQDRLWMQSKTRDLWQQCPIGPERWSHPADARLGMRGRCTPHDLLAHRGLYPLPTTGLSCEEHCAIVAS